MSRKLSVDNEACSLSQSRGCFIKGTPVHTQEGLKPIDQVRVGDYVLSSPRDGSGAPAFKRVLKTFVHEGRPICRILTFAGDGQSRDMIAATGDHPFWVEGRGWTRADQLPRDAVLRKADGGKGQVDQQLPVYRTEEAGIGWVQTLRDFRTSSGTRFDYENYRVLPGRPRIDDYLPAEVRDSPDPYLKVTVYNLEVEDHHTYYVGYDGALVRDQDAGQDPVS